MKKVQLDLCKANSVCGRFVPATVVQSWEIDEADLADELEAARQRLPNGYFVRQHQDKTGAEA